MQRCSMPKNNGMFNSNMEDKYRVVSNPQFVFWGRQRYNELVTDVGEVLKTLPCAFIKGDILSIMAYGKLGARMFSDIDILLPWQTVH